jgi:acyl-CoA thioesterase FadM
METTMPARMFAAEASRSTMVRADARKIHVALQGRKVLMYEKHGQRRAMTRTRAVDAVVDVGVEAIESTSSVRRVYIEHTDAYQVMFYANYFRFAADACEEALAESGVGGGGVDARMVAVRNCKYARAARLGDDVRVRTRWVRSDEASGRATFEQTVEDARGEAYLSAEVTYALLSDARGGVTTTVDDPHGVDVETSETMVRLFRDEQSRGADGSSHVDVLRYFERGRTDAIGGSDALSELKEKHGVVVVVSRLEAEFPERILPRESLDAASGIPTCGVKSTVEFKRRNIQVVFHQALYAPDGVTCVGRADITCTCLDATTMRPISCPDALVQKFVAFTV